jgi:hypothetical protein
MNSIKAMEQALAAFEQGLGHLAQDTLRTAIKAAQTAPVQESVAYLFTNVQSGDIEASTDPDHKEGEREMWHREPLGKLAAAPLKPVAWMPETTAPKDGSRFLALDIYGVIQEVEFSGEYTGEHPHWRNPHHYGNVNIKGWLPKTCLQANTTCSAALAQKGN